MFGKVVLLSSVLVGAGWAVAQDAQEIDPDLLAYIEGIEADTGTTRFGPVHVGEMEGGQSETVSVTFDPNTYTFIAVICGPSCEEITGAVQDDKGREIVPAPQAGYDVVIQLPPGKGDRVLVKVDMLACDWDSFPYAIQSFTRPGQ